ncbi:unnamed protein product [Arabidopsis halleri]
MQDEEDVTSLRCYLTCFLNAFLQNRYGIYPQFIGWGYSLILDFLQAKRLVNVSPTCLANGEVYPWIC